MRTRTTRHEASITVQLVDKMYLETDGTTTDRRVYVKLPEHLAQIGPELQGIQGITQTENMTTNFRWNAEISKGTDGLQFFPATPDDIFSYVTADGVAVQTELTDTTKFGAPFIRINLACSNSTGSARESATVSLWLTFNFKR